MPTQRAKPRKKPVKQEIVIIAPPKRKTASKTKRKVSVRKPGAIAGAGNWAGGALGSAFGPAGAGVGSFLGGKLGHLIETVTGFGDYSVDQNTILKGGMGVPQVMNSLDNGNCIIRHREFIGNIQASIAFAVQTFTLQPGLAKTFPWLSQIANSYEQYRLRGVLFEFSSTSSDALLSTATSTALGSVIMMTDYDVADEPPTSKRQMLNSEWACSSKPSLSFIHPIECKKSVTAQNILYTRGAAVPDNYDARLYDFANFHIATEGMQAVGGILGELWVTYEIELLKQQFAFFGSTDHYKLTVQTAARPLGTVSGSNIGSGGTIGGLINGLGTTYSFPPNVSSGKWLVVLQVYGALAANIQLPTPSYINATALGIWNNNTTGGQVAPLPAVATNMQVSIRCDTFTITGESCSIVFPGTGVFPGATTSGDLYITRLPDSLTV